MRMCERKPELFMNLLIIHQNFPGQFRHVALAALNRRDTKIFAIGRDTAPGLPGIKIFRYKSSRKTSSHIHPYLHRHENALDAGQQVLRILKYFKHNDCAKAPNSILVPFKPKRMISPVELRKPMALRLIFRQLKPMSINYG